MVNDRLEWARAACIRFAEYSNFKWSTVHVPSANTTSKTTGMLQATTSYNHRMLQIRAYKPL